MPIYDHDGTTTHEISVLYDNDGSTWHQIGKAYDNNGSADTLIYTDALPTTLLSGSSTASEIGGWNEDTQIWETTSWLWWASGTGKVTSTSSGLDIAVHGIVDSRNGKAIVSKNMLDWSGTKHVTVTLSHTQNGYFGDGSVSQGTHIYGSLALQTSAQGTPVAFNVAGLSQELGQNNWLGFDIPSNVGKAYLRICIFTTDGGGFTATIKSITTTTR